MQLRFLTVIFVWLLISARTTIQAEDATLIQQWRLNPANVQDQNIRSNQGGVAVPARPAEFDEENLLVFSQGQFLVVKDGEQKLPRASFAAEAWVRVDRPTRWGCIVGFQQDNGAYEKGWSLGYNNDHFEFRVSDGARIINATAAAPLTLAAWHHVVGVCDVQRNELRLYVDGQPQSSVPFQAAGPVYPDAKLNTELVIGAYKDADELFPLQGRLREWRLYDGVISEALIAAHVQWQDQLANKPLKFSVRPGVRFLTPRSAEVRWETTIAGLSALAYGSTRKLGKVIVSDARGTSHRVVIDELIPGADYYYRFGLKQDGKQSFSPFYQLEGSMNYTPPSIEPSTTLPPSAARVLDQLQQPGGYAVTIGGDHQWASWLASATSMTIVAAADDQHTINKLRRQWYGEGKYGIRLTAQLRSDLPAEFANLVIATTDELATAGKLRAPLGVIIALGSTPRLDGFAWTDLGNDVWLGKPTTLPELAAWGHQYGSAGNASYSGETLGGVDDTADLELKWIGRPGADFGIDRNPRMPAPLAVGGRLYHQGMNRMIALDAFNGAVLWSLEIPDLRRVNIPRDSANWCADQSQVFAAVKDRLWVIDGATGEMQRTMLLPQQYAQDHEWGYVAVTDDIVIGTAMKQGSGYAGFWDKAAWYDGKNDAATAKVCGDAIVAYDKDYGSIRWTRPADAIVHSTIAIAGSCLYFVEVDDPTLKDSPTGKLTNSKIWDAASIVCVDLRSGTEKWKRQVPPQEHEAIISFGIADDQQYVLQTSGKNQFHFSSLHAQSGDVKWQQSVDWPEDHHGAHVQHAVLMNGRIFVQPHILDANDGRILKSGTLGKRRGCATPIGAGNSVIYRGGSGPLTLWSLEKDKPTEFTRLRPSCWLSTIPAQGMLFSPEGGGGCSCGGWMETSIGFVPVVREER